MSLRIIYMGTPEFAVEPLKHLVEKGYNIVSVVTMPDKPIGRGQKMGESAVKKYAASVGLPILQPERLKSDEFVEQMRVLKPDLAVVVAFKMLPQVIWSMPTYGTFNLHTSLLPDYRGAAPINWAIINGDKVSGVTTFMLDSKIDTGDIIESREVEITPTDTAGTLHDKLMAVGAVLVEDSVKMIEEGRLVLKPQNNELQMRPAPKIFKPDCKVDWNKDCTTIHNLIRGLSPYPAAWSDFDGRYGEQFSMKIFSTEMEICAVEKESSSIVTDGKNYLKVACSDGYINILEMQLSGKKRMSIKDFLRGNKEVF